MQRQRQSLNRREKRALARIILAVVLLSLFFFAITPGRSLRAYFSIKKKIEAVERENERLRQETAELYEAIRRLKHDDKYLEKIAREKYGMLKKNEEVYYIQSAEAAEPPPEDPGEASDL